MMTAGWQKTVTAAAVAAMCAVSAAAVASDDRQGFDTQQRLNEMGMSSGSENDSTEAFDSVRTESGERAMSLQEGALSSADGQSEIVDSSGSTIANKTDLWWQQQRRQCADSGGQWHDGTRQCFLEEELDEYMANNPVAGTIVGTYYYNVRRGGAPNGKQIRATNLHTGEEKSEFYGGFWWHQDRMDHCPWGGTKMMQSSWDVDGYAKNDTGERGLCVMAN